MVEIKNYINDLKIMSKDFVYKYGFIIDFLCASVIICLCLIVLLPKVHDSFAFEDDQKYSKPTRGNHNNNQSNVPHTDEAIINEILANQDSVADPIVDLAASIIIEHQQPNNTNQDQHNHHHHHHAFPVGEFIISAGFLLFYIIGLCLERSSSVEESGRLQSSSRFTQSGRSRRNSTICCPSTRCPSSRHQVGHSTSNIMNSLRRNKSHSDTSGIFLATNNLQDSDNHVETTALLADQNEPEDCVLLFNRHHNHHTHSRHHEHNHKAIKPSGILHNSSPSPGGRYGSTTPNQYNPRQIIHASSPPPPTPTSPGEQITQLGSNIKENNRYRDQRILNPEEISIALLPRQEKDGFASSSGCFQTGWPRSIKVSILSLVFVILLLSLEIQMDGLIQAVKVFRAAATGALLYIAFFLILPRDPPGCKSCREEEIEDELIDV